MAIGIAAALLTGASPASATVYCVAPASGGDCAVPEPDFQQALNDASTNPGQDTVRLGATTYATTTQAGFIYNPALADPVAIVGAGAGPGGTKIAVAQPSMDPAVPAQFKGLTLSSTSSGSSASDLAVELPAPAFTNLDPAGNNERYVAIQDESADATLSKVTISSPPATPIYATGVFSTGGTTISDATITLNRTANLQLTYGLEEVANNSGDMRITHSSIAADNPLRWDNVNLGATLRVERSTLLPGKLGVEAATSRVDLQSTLIDLGGFANAVALGAGYSNPGATPPSSISADGVTIVGSGDAQTGASAQATDDNTAGTDTATIDIANSVIDLEGTNPVAISRFDAFDGTASVSVDFSDLDSTTNLEDDGSGMSQAINPGILSPTNNLNHPLGVSPGFVSFGTDYHLAPGSPLIDAGGPAPPAAGALDIDGDVRAILGLPGCTARRDIGADERAPSPATTPNCPGSSSPGASSTPAAPSSQAKKKCKKHRELRRGKCVKKKKKTKRKK
ncbi:MAG: hypothetical protein ACXWXU_04645 [Solirubrobacterales bacterium]